MMWALTKKIISIGKVTEPLQENQTSVEIIGQQLEQHIAKKLARALAIRMVDAGSCNACELEIKAIYNPYYNIERFGVRFVASPRHADLLLVTGPVTRNMEAALKYTYAALPEPKCVVAVGDCAQCGGVFQGSYAIIGAVSAVIPVNVVVMGCPPTPSQIMQGILSALLPNTHSLFQ